MATSTDDEVVEVKLEAKELFDAANAFAVAAYESRCTARAKKCAECGWVHHYGDRESDGILRIGMTWKWVTG